MRDACFRTDLRLRLCVGVVVAVGATAVVPSLVPEVADATFPGDAGKIAFRSFETFHASLRTVDPRSRELGRIRPECPGRTCEYLQPAWSPSGKRLAFYRGVIRPCCTEELVVSRADGSDARRVASDLHCAAWSPGGRRLVAVGGEGSGPRPAGIYVISISGSRRRLVVRNRGGNCPDWSSRDRIAFTRFYRRTPQSPNSFDIITVRPAGDGLKRLTRDGRSVSPSWSPHGSKIAYTRYGKRGGIWVMNADGSGKHQIAARRGEPGSPVWSPDGQRIAFVRRQSIFVIRSDGSGRLRRIRRAETELPSPLSDLAWQPRLP